MIDTKVKVNGKTVGEYDLINEPCVKKINGEGPDDNGNVEVERDGPTINGGYDIKELVTVTDETATSGQLLTNYSAVTNFFINHIGETVIVTFDGTLYQCTINGAVGSECSVGDSNYVEQPFYIYADICVGSDPYDPAYLRTAIPGESHTVKIEGYKATPVVFDRKYIPDLQTLTNSMVWQKGRFLRVNDNGVPEWVMVDAMKNPNSLSVKIGDTTVTYDGSEAKEIIINSANGASF